jgi:hypothetical protein
MAMPDYSIDPELRVRVSPPVCFSIWWQYKIMQIMQSCSLAERKEGLQ